MIGSRICAVALTVASAVIYSAPTASAFDGYYGHNSGYYYYGYPGYYGYYGYSVRRRMMETGTCTPRPHGVIAKASSLAS